MRFVIFLLFIYAAYSQILPLGRYEAKYGYDRDTQHFTVRPYTLEVQLGVNRTVNLMLDSATQFLFVQCCQAENPAPNCIKKPFCTRRDNGLCPEDRPCPDKIHTLYIYYPLSNEQRYPKPYDFLPYFYNEVNIFRLVPDILIPYISIDKGKHIQTGVTNQTLLEVVFTDEPYYHGVDGTLGLAFSPFEASFFGLLLKNLDKGQRIFALDFRDEPVHRNTSNFGYMIFGKSAFDEYMQSHTSHYASKQIIWSERQFRANSFLLNFLAANRYSFHMGHRLTLYDMRLCNASLFSNYTSNWQAEINTRIEGLGLPEDYYYMILSWLEENNLTNWENASFAEKIDLLPVLTFKFSEYGQDVLEIPLSSLVEKTLNGSYFFHLYNKGEILTIPRYGVIRPLPVIDIGTRILHRYLAVYDVDNLRVGFVKKQENAPKKQLCKSKPKCRGAQTYYESSNSCVDPACYLYLLQSVDEASKTCRMRIEFYIFFGLVVILLAVCEICIFEFYQKFSQSIGTVAR